MEKILNMMGIGNLKKINIPIQLHQNINLILIIVISKFVFNIPITYFEMAVVWGAVGVTDYVLNKVFKRNKKFSLSSSINTGVEILFFLKSQYIFIYIFTSIVSILSKYIIKIKDKHFFNPSNFGLVLVFLLFPNYTWIIGTHWELNYLFIGFVALLASIILIRINLILVPIGFIVTYFGGNFLFGSMLLSDIFGRITNVTFMLFFFFMLSDPRIFPYKAINTFMYGSLVALTLLLMNFFIAAHFLPLLSLFVVTLITFLFYFVGKTEKVVKKLFQLFYLMLIGALGLSYILVQ